MGFFKTFKAFTNLEQSKKLAEILPIESADLGYRYIKRSQDGVDYYTEETLPYQYANYVGIPCWSLAALLEVLPHRIDEICELDIGKLSGNDGWYVCYDGIDRFFTNSNLIDACYKMILKLHEQKLI